MRKLSESAIDPEMESLRLTRAVRTNGVNTIVIPAPTIAFIRLLVLDEDEGPLVETPYQILDEEHAVLFEGQTNAQGYINHDDVSIKDYILVIGGYFGEIAAVIKEEERVTVFLPELGYIRLMIFDCAESYFANMPYTIKQEEVVLFKGKTNDKGGISHDLVPLQDFILVIGQESIPIAAVNYEDEMVSVFLNAPLENKSEAE